MKISKAAQRIKRKFFFARFKLSSYSSREKMLRKICYHIGTNTRICNDDFGSEPYMISIGNDVIIASGVKFIEHDASFFNVCRYLKVGSSKWEKIGPIIIGNNVFVGANSLLLPGTDIGDNSIIAAGAVVNCKIPPGEVWGGVPAKYIMSMDQYALKVKNRVETLPWYSRESCNDLIKLRQDYYFKRQEKKNEGIDS